MSSFSVKIFQASKKVKVGKKSRCVDTIVPQAYNATKYRINLKDKDNIPKMKNEL